ncbi:MAG: hypothetical protein ACREDF_11130 [Thermoplasmata archaeon]
MKVAYCRDCKTVIAMGDGLAPQRTVTVKGKKHVLKTMPYHTVDGKEHRNVGLFDIPGEPTPAFQNPDQIARLFKDIAKKYKTEFK